MNTISKYILGLSLLAGVVSSCKNDEPTVSGFSLDVEEMTFADPNGGVSLLNVTTDTEWQASTEATWLQLTPGNGNGSAAIEVKADSSVLANMRETVINFQAKGLGLKTLKVKQFGYKKEIVLGESEVSIESNAPQEERFFTVDVTANVNFTVEIPEDVKSWIEFDKSQGIELDYGERPRSGKFRFDWKINTKEDNRVGEITFRPVASENGEEAQPVVLKITQEHAPILTDDRAGDSLAVLSIYQGMNGMFGWDASENMRNWKVVTLWRANDKIDGKPVPQKMVGRVRSASFSLFDTKESIPYQVTQLRFAESLVFYSNANREIKNIELGPEICTLLNGHPKNPETEDGGHVSYLKHLDLSAFGINKLPSGFESKTLESLELNSMNFTDNSWLNQINKNKLPNLKYLSLSNMRIKSVVNDLSNKDLGFRWETGFGNNDQPYNGTNNREAFVELMKWDNLVTLSLSVNLLEGELPSDEELQKPPYNFPAYQESDFKALGDTISDEGKQLLIKNKVTKVWPNMKALSINLNFLTGKLPNWMLYHPNFDFWNPYSLIFQQEIKGKNSLGETVGFIGTEPRSMSDFSNLTEELGYDEFVSKNSYYKVYPKRNPDYKEPETK